MAYVMAYSLLLHALLSHGLLKILWLSKPRFFTCQSKPSWLSMAYFHVLLAWLTCRGAKPKSKPSPKVSHEVSRSKPWLTLFPQWLTKLWKVLLLSKPC